MRFSKEHSQRRSALAPFVLENFYDTPPASASQYFIVFAVGNLAGVVIEGGSPGKGT
ncbi:hypothetical protein ACNPM4_03550 [Microbacterium sp. AGC62]